MVLDRATWLYIAATALFAGAAIYLGPAVVVMTTSKSVPPNRALVESLAAKWGRVFGVPPAWIVAIAKIESGFRPRAANLNVRAAARGGAFGLMAMTLSTARDNVARLKRDQNQLIAGVASAWNGTGEGLLEPDLNVMLGAEYMGRLRREFGRFELVAAAYHQGAGKVRKMVAARQAIPAQLPPKGKEYVARALAAQKAIA